MPNESDGNPTPASSPQFESGPTPSTQAAALERHLAVRRARLGKFKADLEAKYPHLKLGGALRRQGAGLGLKLRVREMKEHLQTKPPPGFPKRVGRAMPIPLPAHLPQPNAARPPGA